MKLTADTVAFILLGLLSIMFGFWAHGREDQLLEDDALDDDEHEYRSGELRRGALALLVFGGILVVAGVTLLFVPH